MTNVNISVSTSAELQAVGSDGVVSLHTRSLKYGKLDGGQLIVVPSSLVKRLPQHYVSLQWGVDVLLGRNGYIWISRTLPSEAAEGLDEEMDIAPTAEALQRQRLWHSQVPHYSTISHRYSRALADGGLDGRETAHRASKKCHICPGVARAQFVPAEHIAAVRAERRAAHGGQGHAGPEEY